MKSAGKLKPMSFHPTFDNGISHIIKRREIDVSGILFQREERHCQYLRRREENSDTNI